VSVNTEKGGLTFTIGAETEFSKTIGFRVYDTFNRGAGTNSDQIVAVFSSETGQLKGVVIGSLLGAIRTAAIGGVAMDILAPQVVSTITIIGAGYQAYYQVAAALAVRKAAKVSIFNRTMERGQLLVKRIRESFDVEVATTHDLRQSLSESEIVLCATSAQAPVLESHWLKDNAYVSSIGFKFSDSHELPKDIAHNCAILVTDAKAQLTSYGRPYFLPDTTAIAALEDVISGAAIPANRGHVVFLSSGRSGTEVVVANCAMEVAAKVGVA
jgi:ornithine cyclodeaminase